MRNPDLFVAMFRYVFAIKFQMRNPDLFVRVAMSRYILL